LTAPSRAFLWQRAKGLMASCQPCTVKTSKTTGMVRSTCAAPPAGMCRWGWAPCAGGEGGAASMSREGWSRARSCVVVGPAGWRALRYSGCELGWPPTQWRGETIEKPSQHTGLGVCGLPRLLAAARQPGWWTGWAAAGPGQAWAVLLPVVEQGQWSGRRSLRRATYASAAAGGVEQRQPLLQPSRSMQRESSHASALGGPTLAAPVGLYGSGTGGGTTALA
jgi:hypothetical protein